MKYSQIVAPKKLCVRRETACAMIENAKLFDAWVASGLLKPIDASDPVHLFDCAEIEAAYQRHRAAKITARK